MCEISSWLVLSSWLTHLTSVITHAESHLLTFYLGLHWTSSHPSFSLSLAPVQTPGSPVQHQLTLSFCFLLGFPQMVSGVWRERRGEADVSILCWDAGAAARAVAPPPARDARWDLVMQDGWWCASPGQLDQLTAHTHTRPEQTTPPPHQHMEQLQSGSQPGNN